MPQKLALAQDKAILVVAHGACALKDCLVGGVWALSAAEGGTLMDETFREGIGLLPFARDNDIVIVSVSVQVRECTP